MTTVDRVRLVIPGKPIPLERHRTGQGRTYLPPRSKAFRELVRAEWMIAGRPTLGAEPVAASMRFYGPNPRCDLDNLLKAILDALNSCAYVDDSQVCCFAGIHRLPADSAGPRSEVDLWRATHTQDCACTEPVTDEDDGAHCARCELPIGGLERAA
ncbi:MAG TPA: RusA family crossover junction endodeoxyribonuclease [Solirubrobacteraceae bacterium]|jgi:Holliday junction resolvase RusA-like endonuclease|nr:RusA family crossover junction endodeoxyribonuclease [Solirubrobacteraceae bacterium]